MYLRTVHSDLHLPTLYNFIRSNPLGILTTAIPSQNHSTIQSSHIPWVLDVPESTPGEGDPVGRLRGHVARANPQAKAFIETLSKSSQDSRSSSNSRNGMLTDEVMILFNGPVHHYVTPKFYVQTKPVSGKVVPTWDYSAVQAYGTAKVFIDASASETEEFLATQIDDLSLQSEHSLGYTGQNGRPQPWTVGEAPENYVSVMKKAIIGIEIEIRSLGGKFKMSQELSDGDREGVVQGFEALGTQEGDQLAKTVRERAELKDMQKSVKP